MRRISLGDFFGILSSGALFGAVLALWLHWLASPSEVTPEFHWKEEVFITGGFYKGQEGVVDSIVDEEVRKFHSKEVQRYRPHGAWFYVDISPSRSVIVHKDHLLRKQK